MGSLAATLSRYLAEPATKGLSIDSPETTQLRRSIVREKRLLKDAYIQWYRRILEHLPAGDRPVLELGSGAGFLSDLLPDVITSDLLQAEGVSITLDAHSLPFAADSLRAIVMVDVLHHLYEVRRFFRDASRCVVKGGAIVMIEPWITLLSRVVWRCHHEPFRPNAPIWEFPKAGPLSGANIAIPWMVFNRDREVFQQEFPEWKIQTVKRLFCLNYLVSGGVSMRSLAPAWTSPIWRGVEWTLAPANRWLALFALIVLTRSEFP
ncbi:MAG TPA: methyltransferase domain-containing protein [Pirellulales bacterium]|nr:methyltransferase domain-containing protein [Pirellulales bacterium]